MNKKIYVGMTADIMHPGLIHIIHEATKYGDVIVGLLTDKAIAEHKRLPYLTYDQRKEVVENIKGVCEVVPQEDWSYVPNLEKLKPDYIIHGDDWKTGPLREVREQVFEVMNAQGGKVIEIPYTRGINSSSLDKDIKAIGTTPDVRLKSLRRLIQAAYTGYVGVFLSVQRVQADVQPPYSRLPQRLCQRGQQSSVGGEADLLYPLHRRRPAAYGQYVLFHQRLSPCYAQLVYTQRSGSLHCPYHLVFGEHILVALLAHPFRRHAVAAAEIAKLRHRQAHIVYLPSVLVSHLISCPRSQYPRSIISPGLSRV